jgi:uncharacterized protein YacL
MPEPSFLAMNVENVALGGLGLLAGLLMNNVGKYLTEKYPLSVTSTIAVQLVLSSMVLTVLYRRLKSLDLLWKNDISAAFFVSLFFGVQYVTFVQIQAAYGIKRKSGN